MRRLLLPALLMLTTSCGARPTAPPPSPAPTPRAAAPTPYRRAQFSADEVKKLNAWLPEKVREVLEQADRVELFRVGGDKRSVVLEGDAKAELLDAFYEGVIRPDPEYGCFKPHHWMRAKGGGDEVEIKVCFICKNFVGNSARLGWFNGRVGGSPEAAFERALQGG